MGSKRGLSDVVTTVVIVALSLVAITVVWIVIQNIISSNTSTVNLQRDCLDIQLEVSLDENYLGPYDSGGYVKFFTIERVSGNVPFDGVKLIARNSKIGYEDAKYYPLNLSVGERGSVNIFFFGMELKKPLNEEGNPDLDELLRYLSFYGAWGEGYTGHLPVDEYSYVPYFEIDGKKVECSTLQTKKVSH